MQARIETAEQLINEVLALSVQLRKRTGNLPAAAMRLLECLYTHGPLTVPQVGRHRRTSRQNIQIIANGLIKNGWVTSSRNPAHKRSPLLSLTPKAAGLLSQNDGEDDKMLPLSGVSEDDLTVALNVLRQLSSNLRAPAQWPTEFTKIPESPGPSDRVPAPATQISPTEDLPVALL